MRWQEATVRYVIALGLIALVSTGSFVTLNRLIAEQAASAPTINVAGRQRMLSQRIAGLVNDPSAAEELRSSLERMKDDHHALTQGDDTRGIPPLPSSGPVHDIYHRQDGVIQQVDRFLGAARRAVGGEVGAQQEVLQSARKPLLRALDQAAKAHEQQALEQTQWLRNVELGLWILTLLLLVAEAFLIFRPLVSSLSARIVELTESEARLNARESRLRLLLASAGDALIPVDLDGHITSGVSNRARDWFDKMEPGAYAPALLSEGDSEIQEALEVVLHRLKDPNEDFSSVARTAPVQFRRSDDVFRIELREIREEGTRVGSLIIIRQVTALVERQQAREEQLELKRTLDAADAANQAKSRFLATMSHELRTPLNAIIGYTELIGEDPDSLPKETHEDLGQILHAAKHLLHLIDQVLDLAKVESGHMEVSLKKTDVNALLEELAPVGRTLAEAHGNHWQLDWSQDDVPVTTDRFRVKQVLLNLISNSAKFTKNGSIRLNVAHKDDHLSFHVIDTGIGMTPEQQQRVWQEYTQADDSTSRKYGGTGLGLALARHMAGLLGGQLHMTSEKDVGTAVEFRIPCRPIEPPGDSNQKIADPKNPA